MHVLIIAEYVAYADGIRDAFSLVLSQDGHTCAIAKDCLVGLTVSETLPPNAVILNYPTQGIEIPAFISQMRQIQPDCHFILMSLALDIEEPAKKLGVPYFVLDSFDPETLLAILRTFKKT